MFRASGSRGWLRRWQWALAAVLILLRLAFTLSRHTFALPQAAWAVTAALLAACLWWVAKRQVSPEAGLLALLLFLFSPCWQAGVETAAALGLFVMLFTAEGVAHAMQGPRRKWPPRLALLAAVAAGTAAADPAAALLGLALSAACMLYLGAGRRVPIAVTVIAASMVATIAALARPVLTHAVPGLFLKVPLPGLVWHYAGVLPAAAASAVLWSTSRRSRFFGNSGPLLAAAACLCVRQPLWALPLGLLGIAGLFGDGFISSRPVAWRVLAAACVALQALAPALPR